MEDANEYAPELASAGSETVLEKKQSRRGFIKTLRDLVVATTLKPQDHLQQNPKPQVKIERIAPDAVSEQVVNREDVQLAPKPILLANVFPEADDQEIQFLRKKIYRQTEALLDGGLDSLIAVPIKYEKEIRSAAAKEGFSPLAALAIATIENGGKVDNVSSAGAVGMFQLLPTTADRLSEELKDPKVNIPIGVGHLKENVANFGNAWFAMHVHNLGYGNLWHMLDSYMTGHASNATVHPDNTIAKRVKTYEAKHDKAITFYRLLEDTHVKAYMQEAQLQPEAEYYPYQASAALLVWQLLENYRARVYQQTGRVTDEATMQATSEFLTRIKTVRRDREVRKDYGSTTELLFELNLLER